MKFAFFKLLVVKTHSYIKNAFVIYNNVLYRMFNLPERKRWRMFSEPKRILFIDNLVRAKQYDSAIIIHRFLYFFFFIFIVTSLTNSSFYQMDSGNFLLLFIYGGFFLLGNYYQTCVYNLNKKQGTIFAIKASALTLVRTTGGCLKGAKRFTIKSRLIRGKLLYNYVLYSHILCDLMRIYSLKEQSHFFSALAEQHLKRVSFSFLPTEIGPNVISLAKNITTFKHKEKVEYIKKLFF